MKRIADSSYDVDELGGDDDEDDDEEEHVPSGKYGGGGWRPNDNDSDDDEEDEEEVVSGSKRARNPLLVDAAHLVAKPTKAAKAAATTHAEEAWFGQGLFAGMDEDDDEADVQAMAAAARAKRSKKEGKRAAEAEAEEDDEEEDAEMDMEPVPTAAKAKAAKAKAAKTTKPAPAPAVAAAEPPAAAAMKPFIKASKFGGAKAGYVFKKDLQGTGYYLDVAASSAGKGAKAAAKAPKAAVYPTTRVGDAVQPVGKAKAKRAKETAKETAAADADATDASSHKPEAAAAAAVLGGGVERTRMTHAERKRRRGTKNFEDTVPDNGKYVDDEAEEGAKVKRVGGQQAAQYESDEEEGEMKGAGGGKESLQAAIDRQAEAIVLGQMLLNPSKRRQLEDNAYNRHTRNDRGLPQWFLDDERKFATPDGFGVDMDDSLLDKAKNGLKDITAHSIGKVAEAKARKQRRTQRALTKLKKKANAIANKEDLSEREKSREVEKLYKKKIDKKERKRKTLVVGRRFEAGGSGKKGHGIKMVDSRSRSDVRGEKNSEKRSQKQGGNSKGKKGGQKVEQRKGPRQKKSGHYGRR